LLTYRIFCLLLVQGGVQARAFKTGSVSGFAEVKT
jgi:hypothetical protein